MVLVLSAVAVNGYVQSLNLAAAIHYAGAFSLDDAGLAYTMGWIGLGGVAAVGLGRLMDRIGRRAVMLWSLLGVAAGALTVAGAAGLVVFVVAQAIVITCAVTVLSACTVIIAEELPAEQRARGQAWSGITVQVSGGAAIIAIAALASVPGGWRWAWVGLAVLAFAVLLARGALRETTLFRASTAQGTTNTSRISDLMHPRFRRSALGVTATYVLSQMALTGTTTWMFYFPESRLGLAEGWTTVVVIVGGGIGIAGFPLGALVSNRLGRRVAMPLFTTLFVAGMLVYFSVPRFESLPATVAALTAAMALAMTGQGGSLLAKRTTVTELFPTHLRGSVQGMIAGTVTITVLVTQFLVGWLTQVLGDLQVVIWIAACTALPACVIFVLCVPETRGRDLATLDQAAGAPTSSTEPRRC